MRAAFATLALAGLAAATPAPQAVTSAIAPSSSPPAGCYENYDGTFLIGPVNVSSSSKRDVEAAFEIIPLDKRNTQLGITLKNGILTDPQGRTGYIAANQQFQFDGPPQAGAIWTAGFSVCTNNRLALGNDETWYKCLSGTFYNLYYKSIGGQCIESYIIASPVGGQGGPAASGSPGTGSTATTAAEPSTVATASASGMNSTANATATASSSMSATGSSSMMTTVINGHTTVVPVTGPMTGTNTNTAMTGTGAMTSTTPTPNGSPTGAAASSSSSSVSSGAAPMATLKSEMMGLAAGLLAMAAL